MFFTATQLIAEALINHHSVDGPKSQIDADEAANTLAQAAAEAR
jgi:hypothetical protein